MCHHPSLRRLIIACWVTLVLMGWSTFWTRWDPFLEQQHSGGNKVCRWWLTQASPVVFGCVKPKHVSATDAQKQMVRNANRQNHPSLTCAEVIYGARTWIWAECDWDHLLMPHVDQDVGPLCWDVKFKIRTVWGSWTSRMDPVLFANEIKSSSVK